VSRSGSTRAWRELRLKILARDANTCAYCGDEAKHVDHIIPVAAGGTNDPENLTAACARCNQLKSDKSIAVFSNARTPYTPPLCSLSPMVRFDPPSKGLAP
jgi:5-methylcytosine-specific restriction endonuclease McrA